MKLKRLGMMAMVAAVAASLSVPVFAASGKLTFAHGVNSSAKTTLGSITSTEYEDSMKIRMLVINSSTRAIKSYTTPEISDACYIRLTKNVDGVTGGSYCYYYVDGELEHQSTAWYNFDFR